MALSSRIIGRPFSNYYGLVLRQKNRDIFTRRSTNSFFSCCSTAQSPNLAVSKILQQQHRRISPIASSVQRFSSSTVPKTTNPEDEVKIYVGGLTTQVKGIKYFTLTTTALGLAMQPVIWTKFLDKFGNATTIAMVSFLGFFTLITPFMIHYITRKYVTEIHYNKKTQVYTATTFSFFLKKVETTFTQEEVVKPDMLGIFETFRVRGKSLFVEPTQFPDQMDYVKLMGYDKPMDFTYNEDKEPPTNK